MVFSHALLSISAMEKTLDMNKNATQLSGDMARYARVLSSILLSVQSKFLRN